MMILPFLVNVGAILIPRHTGIFPIGAAPPLRPTATPTAPVASTRELMLKGGWMSACGH